MKIFLKNKTKPKLSLYPPEVLLHNRLEKDVQRMFNPLHYPLFLLFSSKYRVQNDYITPNGKMRATLSFLCACCVIVISMYYMYFNETSVDFYHYPRQALTPPQVSHSIARDRWSSDHRASRSWGKPTLTLMFKCFYRFSNSINNKTLVVNVFYLIQLCFFIHFKLYYDISKSQPQIKHWQNHSVLSVLLVYTR